MSEQTIQEKIQDLLQATSSFENAAVTIGVDTNILDQGYDNMCWIVSGGGPRPTDDEILPGETVHLPGAGFEIEWEEFLILIRRYDQDGTAWTDFRDMRQDVIDMILAYPSLDSLVGCTYFRLSRTQEEPEERYMPDAVIPSWIIQALRTEAGEMVTQTTGEYT